MKTYLDKQGLDTLATEIKNKFVPTPALGQPESILTLDKHQIIRQDNLTGVLKYKGLLNSIEELPSTDSSTLGDIFGIKSDSIQDVYQTLYILTLKPLEGEDSEFQKEWIPIQHLEKSVKPEDLEEIVNNLEQKYNSLLQKYDTLQQNYNSLVQRLEAGGL